MKSYEEDLTGVRRVVNGGGRDVNHPPVVDLQSRLGNAAMQKVVSARLITTSTDELSRDNHAGRPLPADVRAEFEVRYGADLGEVRVHDDKEAHAVARDYGALALTHGDDIVFGDGRFAPESAAGQLLLAHELAHVVQYRRHGSPARGVSDTSDPHEREAHRAGGQAIAGRRVDVVQTPTSATSLEEEGSWLGSAWNAITNNALSGATGLLDTAGKVSKSASWLFPGELMGAGNLISEGVGDALALGGMQTGQALRTIGQSPIVRGANKVLGPLGVLSNAYGIYDTVTKPGRFGGVELLDTVAQGAGLVSSGITTASLFGGGTAAAGAGAAGAGGGVAGAGGLLASLGPVGAVLGSFAGGVAAGHLMDQGVGAALGSLLSGTDAQGRRSDAGWLPGFMRDDAAVRDEASQDSRWSLSGMLARGMGAVDRGISGAVGWDESTPEYQRTLGWQLGEILPSWMQ